MTFQILEKCRMLLFPPNTSIFRSLVKSRTSSSNAGKQQVLMMAHSYNLTNSDILLWYGFKWLPDTSV